MTKKNGFSLIELLIALSIIGIVLAFSLPQIVNYTEQTHADTRIIQLYNVLTFARNHALASNMDVILCPSANLQTCGGNWSGNLIVFSDTNKDNKHNMDEPVLRVLEPNIKGSLTWKAFGSANYLKFVPYGFSNQQNGTFIYCSPSHQFTLSRGIIMNKSGRARFAEITDEGGIIDANGQEIRC
ncbi:MAG: prepilin-type N-terminal cleavage/methylation domain-containing protein [Legionellales bacterium]|nr:prepilin-type N-terminal cleavage/methylation domain-containing protein [Legionellales bacterium]